MLGDLGRVCSPLRRKLKRRLFAFVGVAGLAVVAGIAGLALNFAATQVNNQDYDLKIVLVTCYDNIYIEEMQ